MKHFSARYTLLWLIIVLAFFLRLYKITNPVLDWHSFRQADTASVTREYVKNGIDLLRPKYHDLANIQSGHENIEGWRMVEFPLINALTAMLVMAFPMFSLDIVSRLVSVLFSLGSVACLFFFTKKISGAKVAYLAALVFSVLPYSVYYSRAILPEAPLVFFFLFSLLSFMQWQKHAKFEWYLASLISLMMALLLKPFVIFFMPVYVALLYAKDHWRLIKKWHIYPYFLLSIVPFVWWRIWIQQFPSGIPASDWLFNNGIHNPSGNFMFDSLKNWFGYNPDGIRYRPAWFRWLVYERFIKLQLGYALAVFPLLAVYKLKRNELLVYGSWWLAAILYVVIIARGNVQHDYYQYVLVPLVSITVARGIAVAEKLLIKRLSPIISVTILSVLFIVGVVFAWSQVGGYYAVNHPEYIQAGKAVDQLVPVDAKVIAPAFGDTMFLYQTNRTGWPIGFYIEEKINMGATHYVSTNYDDEARMLEKKYFTIQKTPEYIIIDLTKPSMEQT